MITHKSTGETIFPPDLPPEAPCYENFPRKSACSKQRAKCVFSPESLMVN